MNWSSLRLRLTAWNLAVLALALVGFILAVTVGNQRRMEGDIDRELRMRAQRAGQGPRAGEPRGPMDLGGPGGPGGFGGGPMRQFGGEPPPSSEGQGAVRRVDLPSVRLPQIYDRSGTLIGPRPDARPFSQPLLVRSVNGREGFATVDYDGEPIRVFSMPRYQQGRIVGAVQVARELRDFRELWASQLRLLLVLLPLALLAAGAGALFLTSRALRPVAVVTAAASEIGVGDLSRRLPVEGNDEFAELSSTFNGLIARLEAAFGDREAAYRRLEEAYDAHRRFTADASHELRTPLTRLSLATSEGLDPNAGAERMREALQVASTTAEGMGTLVRQLLLLSRADTGHLGLKIEPLDLRVIATDAADSTPKPGEFVLDLDLPQEPVWVDGDEDHLRRVVVNLLENAFRYGASGRWARLAVGRDATLVVEDRGPGIAAEHLPHLFDRFYRVDPARAREDGGCGLGLAIVKSIVEAHGGSVGAESQPGRGTTFTVSLPSRNRVSS